MNTNVSIIVLLAMFATNTQGNERCVGQYRIEEDKLPIDVVEIGDNNADITLYPSSIEIGIIKRDRRTIYCYDGSSLDSNTGCDEKYTISNPSIRKAREYLKNHKCPTGYECEPDSKCWGSDAEKCHRWELVNDVGPTVSRFAGERWMMFPYHTCVSSWSCNLFKVTVSTHLQKRKGEILMYYMTKDNDMIPVQTSFLNNGYEDSSGFVHFTINPWNITKSKSVPIKCYSSGLNRTICSVSDASHPLYGSTSNVGRDFIGIMGSAVLEVKGPILTVKNGTPTKIHPPSVRRQEDDKDTGPTLTHTASLEDVVGIVNSLSGIQLQSVYNSEVIRAALGKTNKLLRKAITFLSKKYPTLLLNVLEMDGETKWIRDDIFKLCPSESSHLSNHDTNSNCLPFETIYENGEVRRKREEEICEPINNQTIESFNLGLVPTLETELFARNRLSGANTDSLSWGSLDILRLQMIESLGKYNHSVSNVNTQILGATYWWKDLWYYFITGTCVIFWLLILCKLIPARQ